jgi:nicotinate-nucleotide adenylyltransferase
MEKIRTVIFGGSFDPIHVGHLSLASEVVASGLAGEVWFLVSPQNPHKEACRLSDENVRMQMVRLAIEGNEKFKASDFEFTLPRPSYTINTLSALEKAFPDREFVLLIGADNWEKFDRWYRHEEILARYEIIVYPRENSLKPELPAGVTWLSAKLHDVSSTQIRELVAKGCSISGLVVPAVQVFIDKNNLYR